MIVNNVWNFTGTLNPALQDENGQPKRDITTIVHILNDLLCAQYKAYGGSSSGSSDSVSTPSGSSSGSSDSASTPSGSSSGTSAAGMFAISTTGGGILVS